MTPLEELRPGCRLRGFGAGKPPGCSESLALSGTSRKEAEKIRNVDLKDTSCVYTQVLCKLSGIKNNKVEHVMYCVI